jgi:hypothetical protein
MRKHLNEASTAITFVKWAEIKYGYFTYKFQYKRKSLVPMLGEYLEEMGGHAEPPEKTLFDIYVRAPVTDSMNTLAAYYEDAANAGKIHLDMDELDMFLAALNSDVPTHCMLFAVLGMGWSLTHTIKMTIRHVQPRRVDSWLVAFRLADSKFPAADFFKAAKATTHWEDLESMIESAGRYVSWITDRGKRPIGYGAWSQAAIAAAIANAYRVPKEEVAAELDAEVKFINKNHKKIALARVQGRPFRRS